MASAASSSHTHDHSHSHSHTHHDHEHSHHDSSPATECTPASTPSPHPPTETEKHRRQKVLTKLKTASLLCLLFFLIEVIGGLLSGSLAVLSDAAHLCADLSAFVVAISGSHIASLPASETHTFGLKRSESLAALFSMVSLAILSVGLAVEAVRRLWVMMVGGEVVEVDGKLMASIAFIGVVVNVVLAYVLGEDHVHMPGADHGHDHSHGHDHHDDHSHEHCHKHSNSKCTGHDSHDSHNDHNGHSHEHHHDEETGDDKPLLSSHKHDHAHSYSAITNEPQHLDEVLPESPCKETTNNTELQNLADNTRHTITNLTNPQPSRNVNLHAAYLHVLADLTQSIIVFLAGLLIYLKPTWQIADPICTLLFSILVFYSTIGVIRSSLSVLLEEVPPGVHWEQIYDRLSEVEGVSDVHDLHIWSISHGNFILSVHATAVDCVRAYKEIKEICNREGISHLTVQLQPGGVEGVEGCLTCHEGSVHQCR